MIGVSLRDVEINGFFYLNLKGVTWKKLQEQGMNNKCTYATTIKKTNTRCQRPGYKHKYLDTDRLVYITDIKELKQ